MQRICLLITILAALAGHSWSQAVDYSQFTRVSDPVDLYPWYGWLSGFNHLAADGDLLVANGEQSSSIVADVSDPDAPVVIGSPFWRFNGAGIDLDGALLVEAHFGGIGFVDLTDPASPTTLGELEHPAGAWYVVKHGPWVYASTFDSALLVVDASEPSAPVLVHELRDLPCRHLTAEGDRLYLASGSTVTVLDITDRAAPVQLGQWTEGVGLHDMAVQGGLVYLASEIDALTVVDATDGSAPVTLSTWNLPHLDDSDRVANYGQTVFVGVWDGGVTMVDAGDPAAPAVIGHISTPPGLSAMTVVGDHLACTTQGSEIFFIELNNHDVVEPEAVFPLTSYPERVVALPTPSHCLVASASELVVIDHLDPENVIQTADLVLSDVGVRGLITIDDYVLLGTESQGLQVFDLGDPGTIAVLDAVPGIDGVLDLRVLGSLAAVLDPAGQLHLVDPVAVPGQQIVASYSPAVVAEYLAVSGTTIYLDSDTAVEKVDASDPTSPTQVNVFDTEDIDVWRPTQAHGEFLYRIFGHSYMHVYRDTGDELVFEGARLQRGSRFAPHGQMIYAASQGGFHVLQANDGANLPMLGSLRSSAGFWTEDVAISGQHVVAVGPALEPPAVSGLLFAPLHSDGTVGVPEQPVSTVSPAHFTGCAPNPGNPRSTISFNMPRAGLVTVTVHDLRGRRVATLTDEHHDTGSHHVTWNGRLDNGAAAASGVYLVHLRTADGVDSQKLSLVK